MKVRIFKMFGSWTVNLHRPGCVTHSREFKTWRAAINYLDALRARLAQ